MRSRVDSIHSDDLLLERGTHHDERKTNIPIWRTGYETTGFFIRAERVYHYIIDHLGAPLTLNDLSDVAGVSRNQMIRDFKEVYGTTPVRFLRDCRLEYARWLLAATETDITEIAFSLGFTDSGHFSKLFRRKYGMTPTVYRKNY